MNAKASVQSSSEALLDDALGLVAPHGIAHRLPLGLQIVHWAIILNLVVQVAYGSFQVFYVLQPKGVVGPMFGHAMEIPFELMMARRMYALESWVAFLGLALYVGLTEILPRRWRLA